ncbi:MAG: hypothetical protein ABR570_07530, partial [Burkholderiales bacterium]
GFGLLADEAGVNVFETGAALAWGHAQWFRALPTVGVLLYDPARSTFMRAGKPSAPAPARIEREVEPPPDCAGEPQELLQRLVDDPVSATAEYGPLLPCLLARANAEQSDRFQSAFAAALAAPQVPNLGWIATALRGRPVPPELVERLRVLLASHARCGARALWLATWASAEEAQAALGEPCWRAQGAARERLDALGVTPKPSESTVDFLRAK